MKQLISIVFVLWSLTACKQITYPDPVGPVPSQKQLDWQEMEFYGFLHFNMNTFTDQEWGYGDSDPKLFNPTELDAKQWARVASEAGMKGLIITAKHHDGFCLWPSAFTEYSVKNSPWRNGEGDVVRELAEACKEYGLKMGIYLSPWDRNHPQYGQQEYINYFRNQLTELLSGYGDIFEVWFDGANGGDGYYGGAKETRRVDKKTYYDWANTRKIIDSLQPNAVGFSDAGPHVRWVGNEHGFSYETTWSPLLKDSVYGGMPEYSKRYSSGQENGTHWVPAEADVSIRPGWYYHQSEDHQVRSLKSLLDIYYNSVGRNATLLLNLPIDRRGLVHESDERQLKKLTNQLSLDFETNLTLDAKINASNIRQSSKKFDPKNCIDNNSQTYWTTDDDAENPNLIFEFDQPIMFNRFMLQEYIALGQRVKKFEVDIDLDGEWKTIESQTTIGYKRILRLAPVETTKIRIRFLESKGVPLISEIGIFNAPATVDNPEINRSKDGLVSLSVPDEGTQIFYTLDGSTPTLESTLYTDPFYVHEPNDIKAITIDGETNRKSDVTNRRFDISKKNWQIANAVGPENSEYAIDDNVHTNFTFGKGTGTHEIVLDLGESLEVAGFSYTPDQRRWKSGIITQYACFGSEDGQRWKPLVEGNFANIIANAITQSVVFETPATVRYLKIQSVKRAHNQAHSRIAELGIITK